MAPLATPGIEHPEGLADVDLPAPPQIGTCDWFSAAVAACHMAFVQPKGLPWRTTLHRPDRKSPDPPYNACMENRERPNQTVAQRIEALRMRFATKRASQPDDRPTSPEEAAYRQTPPPMDQAWENDFDNFENFRAFENFDNWRDFDNFRDWDNSVSES
jgi:hypothetical protein